MVRDVVHGERRNSKADPKSPGVRDRGYGPAVRSWASAVVGMQRVAVDRSFRCVSVALRSFDDALVPLDDDIAVDAVPSIEATAST